jgi:mRNA-decapping enzyme subunit 2
MLAHRPISAGQGSSRKSLSTMADTAALQLLACKPLPEVLDDLCLRFVNNLPDSEYETFERLFFAIEAAHWFYEDFYRDHNASLPRLPLKAFAARLFAHSPVLRPHLASVDALTSQFKSYKQEVPTCGAALLNPDMTRVVLVQGWGKGAKWGFPKGKIGKDESELDAAIREVREETGYDFSAVLHDTPDPYYIDSYVSGRLCRIYVVSGVPEDTMFKTQTRKEISEIAWFPISDLPSPRPKGDVPANSKFVRLVAQYVPKMLSWIKRNQTQHILSASPPELPRPAAVSGSCKPQQTRSSSPGAALRDVDTFDNSVGVGGIGGMMTDRERDEFFRAYLREADKRAEELNLGDASWPVPILTLKDLGPSPPPSPPQRQHRHNHHQGKNPRRTKTKAKPPPNRKPFPVLVPAPIQPGCCVPTLDKPKLSFSFDRKLVMACLK